MTGACQLHCRPLPAVLIACVLAAPSGFALAEGESNVAGLRTFGTSGKAVYPFAEGSRTEAELYKHEGSGCLTHMWFGGNWDGWEETRIRVYVDGEERASIDFQLFLGHGIGYKDDFGPWGTKRIGKTGQPSGVYNTYRIPFGKSVRITAQLAPGHDGNKRFWYIFRGVENMPLVFHGIRLPHTARLRLYKLEDYTAEPLEAPLQTGRLHGRAARRV